MARAPTFLFIAPPLPPFPTDSGSDDLSPLGLVLGFIAIITIPALIYTIVCGVKCPSLSLRRGGRSSRSYSVEISAVDSGSGGGRGVAPPEANHEKESDDCMADTVGGECPVCLSTLSEGEEIKRLSVCRHAFHTACIDAWLESQSNCPVCRASVPAKRLNNPAPPPPLPTAAREVFLRQGFQHVVDLV